MPYQRDHEVSNLFFHRRFTESLRAATDPGRSHSLRAVESDRLRREFSDAEWTAVGPEVQARQQQAAESIAADVGRLLQMFLRDLPGPSPAVSLQWDAVSQSIVEQWLKVPWLCIRALPFVQDKLLDQVPTSERKKYRDDWPALVVRWIRADAKWAWQDNRVRRLLTAEPLLHAGMSVPFTLLLSFVPTLILSRAGPVREALGGTRYLLADVRRRYANPRTALDPTGPGVQALRDWIPAGSDQEIRRSFRVMWTVLPQKTERQIYSELGLDKSLGIADTKQALWNFVALPLMTYVKAFMPQRKQKHDPSVIPASVFPFASRLLALRSQGPWEDKPERLKSRYYKHL